MVSDQVNRASTIPCHLKHLREKELEGADFPQGSGGKGRGKWRLTPNLFGTVPLRPQIAGISSSAPAGRQRGRQASVAIEGVVSMLTTNEMGEDILRERRAPARESDWNLMLAVAETPRSKNHFKVVLLGVMIG